MPRNLVPDDKKHAKISFSCSPEIQKRLADYIESQMWTPTLSQVVSKALDEFLKSQGF